MYLVNLSGVHIDWIEQNWTHFEQFSWFQFRWFLHVFTSQNEVAVFCIILYSSDELVPLDVLAYVCLTIVNRRSRQMATCSRFFLFAKFYF